MPWYAAFSPAFFAFFATPPATRIPVPDMTTVTPRRAARLEVCEAAATSPVSEKAGRRAERRAPAAPARRIFFFLRHRVPGRTTNSRGFRRRARGSR